MNELRRRQARLDRARRLARLELLIAVASPATALFMWMAAPGFFRPSSYGSGSWLYDLAPSAVAILGIAGVVFGLVSMVRIYRADSEPGERTWRYRAF